MTLYKLSTVILFVGWGIVCQLRSNQENGSWSSIWGISSVLSMLIAAMTVFLVNE